MMPLTKPTLITVGIHAFNGTWNDFLGPLLYIQREEKYTLQIGLQVFQNQSTTQWNYLMAGSFTNNFTLFLRTTLLYGRNGFIGWNKRVVNDLNAKESYS